MGKVTFEREIKVVHLQFGSSPSGNYTLRQHEAFLEAGIDSKVLSLYSNVRGDSRVESLGKVGKIIRRVNQKVQDFVTRKNKNRNGAFFLSFLGSDVSQHPFVKQADYVYVHWILGGFLSVKNLRQLASTGKPIIMVMHDMWSITGGCSYSFDCDKFLSKCHKCPILLSQKKNDISARQFEEKREFYNAFNNLFLVSPSNWLYSLAKKAELTKDKPIFHIPNAIDTSLFKPIDKQTAKKILNLEEYDYVIGFGAQSIKSPYKGWNYLTAAINKLKSQMPDSNIAILAFGNSSKEDLSKQLPYDLKFMGFITDDYTTNLVYNASDVFLAPSLADNLPTTIIESMCCGTPVVGFKTGGIPEIIAHQKNGYLSNYKDSDDFSHGIKYCLTRNIKGYLLPQYDKNTILNQHKDLFHYIKTFKK